MNFRLFFPFFYPSDGGGEFGGGGGEGMVCDLSLPSPIPLVSRLTSWNGEGTLRFVPFSPSYLTDFQNFLFLARNFFVPVFSHQLTTRSSHLFTCKKLHHSNLHTAGTFHRETTRRYLPKQFYIFRAAASKSALKVRLNCIKKIDGLPPFSALLVVVSSLKRICHNLFTLAYNIFLSRKIAKTFCHFFYSKNKIVLVRTGGKKGDGRKRRVGGWGGGPNLMGFPRTWLSTQISPISAPPPHYPGGGGVLTE